MVKLKYNLIEAKKIWDNINIWRTYSNHIAATAYAARKHGFRSIGYIRGKNLII